ncbi:MAG: glycosyltransferase family 1 protein [Bacteroidetes bacterium]|nr:glycosyltransferase family 1 protein [Bacteroidota bacterium]
MSERHLHIISFDVPYPANYGGVIDVFYKIKALHAKGIRIHLHCIEYPGRDRADELNQYCEEVHYYPRKMGFISALSLKPYIVSSRRSKEMLDKLLKDDYPILFEGLHSCFYISHKALQSRKKIYRESNIEHRYYFNLFKVDRKFLHKLYFLTASMKLRLYQRVLRHADLMLVVSQKDTIYLKKHFRNNKVYYLPSFHPNDQVSVKGGKGEYVLYHGNIEVPENAHAAQFLMTEVFNDLDQKLVIAGMKPPLYIKKLASGMTNVEIIENPDDETMFRLIRDAHVNILVTFQATGLKLKLLNTLYNGRFCLVNDKMLNGTRLNGLCITGNTAIELKARLAELSGREFDRQEIIKREEILQDLYSNDSNADHLIELIY